MRVYLKKKLKKRL